MFKGISEIVLSHDLLIKENGWLISIYSFKRNVFSIYFVSGSTCGLGMYMALPSLWENSLVVKLEKHINSPLCSFDMAGEIGKE